MSITATPEATKRTTYSVCVGGMRDFNLTVKTYPDDGGFNAGESWVQLEELVANESGHVFKRFLFSEAVDRGTELNMIREAFHSRRARLKQCAQSWRNYRQWRAEEVYSGKKGQLTRDIKYWHGRLLEEAEVWRSCKSVWKSLTRL